MWHRFEYVGSLRLDLKPCVVSYSTTGCNCETSSLSDYVAIWVQQFKCVGAFVQ